LSNTDFVLDDVDGMTIMEQTSMNFSLLRNNVAQVLTKTTYNGDVALVTATENSSSDQGYGMLRFNPNLLVKKFALKMTRTAPQRHYGTYFRAFGNPTPYSCDTDIDGIDDHLDLDSEMEFLIT